MVSWMHILWAAPAFTILGFLCCVRITGGKLEEAETELYRERSARRNQCDRCDEKLKAEAAEADKRALLEEISTNRRTNSQLRGMVERLQAKVWRQTP